VQINGTKIKKTIWMLSVSLILLAMISGVSCKLQATSNNLPPADEDTVPEKEISDQEEGGVEEGDSGLEPEEDSKDILEGLLELSGQNSKPYQLILYINDHIEETGQADSEKMLEIFEKSQKAFTDIYMDILFEGDFQQKLAGIYGFDISGDEIDKIGEGDLKELLTELFNGGYKLIGLEGSYYPFIDYRFYQQYYGYVSGEFIDYFENMAIESDNLYSRDAGLMISWDEIGERLIDSEKYLNDYPGESIRKVEISRLYLNYLSAYLYGQNNTPTREYMTNKVFDEVIDSYRNMIENNPQTVSGGIIADYMGLLESNDYILDDSLFGDIDNYFKRPISEYGLDSYFMIGEQVKNLYYSSSHAADGYIRLSDGVYSEKYDKETGTGLSARLLDTISIGDLDRDEVNDAAVILVSDPGGTGTFYDLHVFINGLFFLYSGGEDFLGDSIKIEDIFIENQKVYIDMLIHGQEDPVCCPSKEVSRAYLIEDHELIKLIIQQGMLETITGEYIRVLLEDGAVLEIMLEDYSLPPEINADDAVTVQYYADYISEQNILYYIYQASLD
jgi:hypothetical protein